MAASATSAYLITSLLQSFVDNMAAAEPATKILNCESQESRSSEELITLYAREVCEAAPPIPKTKWPYVLKGASKQAKTVVDVYPVTTVAGLAQLQDRNNTPPPQNLQATTTSLNRIGEMLEAAETQAIFTAGGFIQLNSPIALRFDKPAGENVGRVCFGAAPDGDIKAMALTILISACDPASFGLAGKDVLDKQYRDALKLDSS